MLRKMPKEDLAEHHFVVENMKNTDHFEYAVQMTRWLLQPMGLWPIKSSTIATVVRPITIVVSTFLLMFLFIPCCMHVFFNETRLSVYKSTFYYYITFMFKIINHNKMFNEE